MLFLARYPKPSSLPTISHYKLTSDVNDIVNFIVSVSILRCQLLNIRQKHR